MKTLIIILSVTALLLVCMAAYTTKLIIHGLKNRHNDSISLKRRQINHLQKDIKRLKLEKKEISDYNTALIQLFEDVGIKVKS